MSLLSALLLGLSHAAPPQSFAHLKKIEIEGSSFLYVDPSESCGHEGKAKEVTEDTGYRGPPTYDVCTLKMKSHKLSIQFNEGPSADPTFVLTFSKGKKKKTHLIPATTLYIPKGSNVYAEGWTNSMFNYRRKFTFNGAELTEVKQPYYYVGLKTKVQKIGGGCTFL